MRKLGCLIVAAALLISGCSLFDSTSPEEVAARGFLDAFARGDTKRAADLTDAPDAAAAGIDQARDAIGPEAVTADLTAVDGASASYTLTWKLPHDRQWRYEARADLVDSGDGWKVRWSPAVLHPELAAQQTLALLEETPAIAPVLGRDGAKLLSEETVISIVLYPAEAEAASGVGSVAGSLAKSLRRFDASITAKSIADGARKVTGANGSSVVAVLREPDYLSVKSAIYDLPGVKFREQKRLLAPEKTFAAQVLPGIRTMVEEEAAGKVGWRVVARDTSGAEVTELHAVRAQPSKAVRTTLSRAVQTSAEKAVDDVAKPAAIVAMTPSTGEILAVAQNAKADKQGAIALTGRYPPGSTFKIATALAALTSGKVGPNSKFDCPGTTVIGSRRILNDDEFHLGRVTLTKAFARSCNTTFAHVSAGLPASALTDAARDLGIGADFEIPGITTITGSAPPAENEVLRAENGFGQGKILASPFGLALAAATAKSGKTPVPSLLADRETKAKGLGRPLPEKHAKALRSMMRAVVTSGTATKLSALPGVHGKTGTAQYGDGSHSHGWFVGYSGDRAFAVLVVGGDSSKPAVDVAHRFLAGLE